MKVINFSLIGLVLCLVSYSAVSQEREIVDSRDGYKYATVKIGNQYWFAENLQHETADSKCYKNKKKNCLSDGRLYPYTDLEKACPKGWRVPTLEDWKALKTHINDQELVFRNEQHSLKKPHLHLISSGYQMGKRLYLGKGKATTFWINQYNDFDEYYHVHIYGERGTYFPINDHWIKEILHAHPISDLANRRFPIRCVCETID